MFKRDILSWWMRPAFLRSDAKKKKVLFAGPWLGEFGWELMNWQAFLRYLAPSYEEVIVCCKESSQAMYSDFATRFVFHNIRATSDCNLALSIENQEDLDKILASIPAWADHLNPVGWQPNSRKRFIQFGTPGQEKSPQILFHPRGRTHGQDRNWSGEKWNQLLEKLAPHFSLGCIGLSNATASVEGDFEDYRDIPLQKTMDLLANAQLVIGPSSGPIHLASLCKTPHLVWTDSKRYARGRTNRTKYEKWWNPLKTPAFVLDQEGFDPSVDSVEKAILHFFHKEDSPI